MYQKVLRHWPVLIIAIASTVILTLPPMIARIGYGIPLNSPSNILIDDETFYFARIHDVLDGHPLIGNAYLWEHKSKPPSPVFLGEFLAAQPIKWLGIGVVAGGVLYDAIFPVIHVLLLYGCLYLICRMRWLAWLATFFIVFGFSLSDLGRVVSPQLNFLFWLSEFFLLFLLISRFDSWRQRQAWLIVSFAALNFGLFFYLYTYYAAFYLAFLGISALLFFARRMFGEAQSFIAIALGGFVVAIPYFVLAIKAASLPEYQETLWRIGMIASHFPSGIAIVIPGVVLLACIALLVSRGLIPWDERAIFFTSGVVGAIVSVNQHVITGKNLEFSSHFPMLAVYWFSFTGVWIAANAIPRLATVRRFAIAGLVLAVGMTVLYQRRDFSPLGPDPRANAERNRASEVFLWLDSHTRRDDVIWTPGLAAQIPIYTWDNVYFSNGARFSFVPTGEILDRFILSHYFETLDRDFVIANLRSIWGVGFIDEALHTKQENRVRRWLGLEPKPVVMIPEELVDRVLARSLELHRLDFGTELKKYRVDYMIGDTTTGPGESLRDLAFLDPVQTINEFTIYRVR